MQPLLHYTLRVTHAFTKSILCSTLLLGTPVAAALRAQDTTSLTSEPARATLDSLLRVEAAKLVRVVGLKQVAFDPVTKTAVVRLYNPDGDTAVINVYVQYTAPVNVKPMLASALLEEDERAVDSLQRDQMREDSVGRLWSLEQWIKEPLPVRLWLAPHQTVQLPLHVSVPPGLAVGEYAAHLVIAKVLVKTLPTITFALPQNLGGRLKGLAGQQVTWRSVALFDSPAMYFPRAAVKLVYVARP